MRKETLQKAIKAGLKKSAGQDIQTQTDLITRFIVTAIEMEDDDDAEPEEDHGVRDAPAQAYMPPSPAIQRPAPEPPPQKSLIIDPSSPTAWEDPKKKVASAPAVPVRMSSLGKVGKPRDYWTMETLIRALEVAPEKILVDAMDREEKVPLQRNIVSDPGIKTVKLVYSFPDGVWEAVVKFTLSDPPELNIEEAMGRIRWQAYHLYKVRPRTLHSSIPERIGGELSVPSVTDPNKSTSNSVGGKDLDQLSGVEREVASQILSLRQ